MKRIVICSVLLMLAVWVSVYSYLRVKNISDELNMRIDTMLAALPDGDSAEILAQTETFTEFWNAEEDVLAHLVRHSNIDIITTSVMRLSSLAKYGNFSELSAELAVIRRQMEDIRSSEMLSFDNLL